MKKWAVVFSSLIRFAIWDRLRQSTHNGISETGSGDLK